MVYYPHRFFAESNSLYHMVSYFLAATVPYIRSIDNDFVLIFSEFKLGIHIVTLDPWRCPVSNTF